jgi:hypothetical protein
MITYEHADPGAARFRTSAFQHKPPSVHRDDNDDRSRVNEGETGRRG